MIGLKSLFSTLRCLFSGVSRVDPDSSLHKDLIQLKNKGGKGNITLNMTFTVSEICH